MTTKRANYSVNTDGKDRLEMSLHDLTNALAAARSFADVLKLRASARGAQDEETLVNSLLGEVDRANGILQEIRRGTYKAGDILVCTSCGYSFVNRRGTGRAVTCRRCSGTTIERWKPSG